MYCHCMECCLVSGSWLCNCVSSTVKSHSKKWSQVCWKCSKFTLGGGSTQYYFWLAFKHFIAHTWLTASAYQNACESKHNEFPGYLLVSHLFLWPRFVDQPKLGHEHDPQFQKLILLRSSQIILHFVSQNLHIARRRTMSSQLSTIATCHPIFALYMHEFPLEFPSARTGIYCLEFKIWKFENFCWHGPVSGQKHEVHFQKSFSTFH